MTIEQEEEGFANAFKEAAEKAAPEDEVREEEEQPVEEAPAEQPEPDLASKIREQEQQIAALTHRISSDDGRVRAYQQRVEELSQFIEQAQEAQPQGSAAPTQSEITDAMGGGQEAWEQFAEEYPDVAKAIESRLDRGVHEVEEKIDSRLGPVEQLRADTQTERGYEYLDNTYVGWRERVNTREFSDWINTQPDVVRSWADSDDVREAASLIQYFDQYLLATGKMSMADPQGAGQPPQGRTGDDAEDLRAKRERQLAGGDSIASRGAGVSAKDSPDAGFSSAFKAFASQRAREAANR